MADKKALTPRFEQALNERGMTWKELAQSCGIPEGTIRSCRQRGRWNPTDALRIISALRLAGLPATEDDLRVRFAGEITASRLSGATGASRPRNPYRELIDAIFSHNHVFASVLVPVDSAHQMRIVRDDWSRERLIRFLSTPDSTFGLITHPDHPAGHQRSALPHTLQRNQLPGAIHAYNLAIGQFFGTTSLDDDSQHETLTHIRAALRFYLVPLEVLGMECQFSWVLNPALRMLIGFVSGNSDPRPNPDDNPEAREHRVLWQINHLMSAGTENNGPVNSPRVVGELKGESLINDICRTLSVLLKKASCYQLAGTCTPDDFRLLRRGKLDPEFPLLQRATED